jgi:hypothetical protein
MAHACARIDFINIFILASNLAKAPRRLEPLAIEPKRPNPAG